MAYLLKRRLFPKSFFIRIFYLIEVKAKTKQSQMIFDATDSWSGAVLFSKYKRSLNYSKKTGSFYALEVKYSTKAYRCTRYSS